MWGFSFGLLYFALAIVIIEANDRDIIKNIKKLKEYAVLTQSVDFDEITEDYTEFESKLRLQNLRYNILYFFEFWLK